MAEFNSETQPYTRTLVLPAGPSVVTLDSFPWKYIDTLEIMKVGADGGDLWFDFSSDEVVPGQDNAKLMIDGNPFAVPLISAAGFRERMKATAPDYSFGAYYTGGGEVYFELHEDNGQ